MRNDAIIEMVDEMLDCDGDVIIGNLTFSRSRIVKRLDPVAYRVICNEMIDSHLEDLQYDLERMDPEFDADDIEFVKERIAELENFSF
jgi:hypothetical protein